MNWLDLLYKIFEVALIPLLGVLTVYIVLLIKAKKQKLLEETTSEITKKYIELLDKTITECVIATNQTYVNTLKEAGSFDLEAQKEAFTRTYEAVIAILADDALIYLDTAISDLETYITNKIETEVVMSKLY